MLQSFGFIKFDIINRTKHIALFQLQAKQRPISSLHVALQKSGSRQLLLLQMKNSKLAQVCDQMIPLKITRVKTPTAGFRTFVANVVTCLQLSGITCTYKNLILA